MNIKRKKLISIAFLCAIAAISLCFGVAFALGESTVKADNVIVDDVEIADYYFIGERLEAPDTVQVYVGDQTFTGKFSGVISPYGDVTEYKNVSLDLLGEYKAVYDYRKGGKNYSAQKSFKVVKKNWEVGSKDSTVEYGSVRTHEKSAQSTGLIVNLSAGDTFYFNEPVDLKSNSLHDIITFYSTAVKKKNNQIVSTETNPLDVNLEAGFVEVKLTDCYDQSKYVNLKIEIRKPKGEGVYARTAASGQGEFGLYYDCPPKFGKRNVYINGDRYGVYNGDYGQSITSASYVNYMKWSVNAQSGDVMFYHPQGSGEQSFLINQLYNSDIGGAVFNGFTTGEVYVSLTASENYTESTTFEIEQIGGRRGAELISGGYFDEIAPSVSVDTKGTKGDVYVKCGEEFTVFDATAYDTNLLGGVTANVYYNYGTSVQSAVAVKNGKFTPVKEGRYVVEYSAQDVYGNVGIYALGVYALANDPATLTVEKVGNFTAGEAVTLPKHTASSRNGEVSVKITATCGGKSVEIDEETRTFIPLSVGEYEITYEYADVLKTYVYSYKVNSLKNDNCSFGEIPVFDRYYIKGLTYSLPKVNAYKYEGLTPTLVDYEVFASFDGGEYVKIDINAATITGNKSVKFKYVVQGSVYESETLEIVDVGYGSKLDMSKYFKGDYSSSASYSHIEFTSKASSGDNELSFINPLALKNFAVEYSVSGSTWAKSVYSIVLKSRENYSKKISVDFTYKAGGYYVSINGGEQKTLVTSINGGDSYVIAYDRESNSIKITTDKQTLHLPITTDLGSEYVMFDVVFHGNSQGTKIKINRIQNQVICRDSSDDFGAQICGVTPSGSVEKDFKAAISAAIVSDVLSPVLRENVRLKVTTPSGAFLKTDDGIELNDVVSDKTYNVTFSEFGNYRIVYSATDASGKYAEQPYIVKVIDVVAPTVTFDDGINENTVLNVKLGYKYKIKKYTAKDNFDAPEKLTVHTFIYNSNKVLAFYDVNEFTLTEAGEYTVFVYVTDTSGNYGYCSYKVRTV